MNVIRRSRDESGSIAIIFALTAALMFGVGALAVDLGNMYQRKAETQSQADLAALSAAPAMGCSATPCETVAVRHQNAVDKVRDYLKSNTKLGQSGGLAALTSTMLTDGDLSNGEVTFPGDYTMQVVTPSARVDFTLAEGADAGSSSNVNASATVGVGTPGSQAILPMYAVQGGGCDYGSQTLTDPANGHHVTSVPSLPSPLHDPGQTSNAVLTSADPYQFDVGVTNGVITTITGQHLSSVSEIEFFSDPLNSPAPPATVVTQAIVSNTNNNSISSIPVPTGVTNYAGVWWIRTYTATGNTGWSPLDQSLPIRIGDGPIQCPSSVVSGNFGTLKFPRTDSTSANWLNMNIANGIQPPGSFQTTSDAAEIPNCTPGDAGVVYSSTTGGSVPVVNTNCVDTDTGLTTLSVTQGLLSNSPSRLANKPTTSSMTGKNCAPGATNNNSRTAGGYTFNNDTLSCFMTSPTTSLNTIASATYNGGAALDPAIFDSPRFVYVPVVAQDPSNGGSGHWSVVGMRAGFITGEDGTSTYSSQVWNVHSSAADNGVTISNGKVTSLQIFLFNDSALPSQGGGAQPGVILDPSGPLVPFLID